MKPKINALVPMYRWSVSRVSSGAWMGSLGGTFIVGFECQESSLPMMSWVRRGSVSNDASHVLILSRFMFQVSTGLSSLQHIIWVKDSDSMLQNGHSPVG